MERAHEQIHCRHAAQRRQSLRSRAERIRRAAENEVQQRHGGEGRRGRERQPIGEAHGGAAQTWVAWTDYPGGGYVHGHFPLSLRVPMRSVAVQSRGSHSVGCRNGGSDKCVGIRMDSLITAAALALAAGDPVGALKRIALRDDAPALALRGIAMAQLGDLARAKVLLKSAARAFGPREAVARARCVVAEAEIALVSRDLGWRTK